MDRTQKPKQNPSSSNRNRNRSSTGTFHFSSRNTLHFSRGSGRNLLLHQSLIKRVLTRHSRCHFPLQKCNSKLFLLFGLGGGGTEEIWCYCSWAQMLSSYHQINSKTLSLSLPKLFSLSLNCQCSFVYSRCFLFSNFGGFWGSWHWAGFITALFGDTGVQQCTPGNQFGRLFL